MKKTVQVLLTASMFLFSSAAFGAAVKVGLYSSTGSKGMKACLDQNKDFSVTVIEKLNSDIVFNYDVIVLGSVKGGISREWTDAIRSFVKSGGGLLLNHDATGFRGWRESLFPDLFKGSGKSRNKKITLQGKHQVTAGVSAEFEHGYMDHITLTPGAKGTVVLKDSDGKAVAVAGNDEFGRVLGCGMIVGYAKLKIGGQMERAPEGGEKEFFISALKWLGNPPLTQLEKSVLLKRKTKFVNAIALFRSAQVFDKGGGKIKGDSVKDWYDDSMLNEHGFIRTPVNLLPGKFFLFDGDIISIVHRHSKVRDYREIVGICRQLKWMGVTDIFALSGGPKKVHYKSKVPGTFEIGTMRRSKEDYLELLVNACAEVGLDVWAFWHVSQKRKPTPEDKEYLIRNAKGEVYAPFLDILSPAAIKISRQSVDEFAERYNKHGNFKGIFLDEFWHSFNYDLLEDNVDDFRAYSHKNFNAEPPENIAEKFALGREWHDPESLWWRRYMLWRNSLIVDFTKMITKYANSKGLKIISQPAFSLMWSTMWFQGVSDSYSLARAGNLMWSYEGRNNDVYQQYPDDKAIFATHTCAPSGYSRAAMASGHSGSLFTFGASWAPIAYGKQPRSVKVMREMIQTSREAYGAKSVKDVSLLVNEMGLQLGHKNASQLFLDIDKQLQRSLNSSIPAGMLMVRDTEYFKRYKTLISTQYNLEHISETVYKKLIEFVESGGQLVLINSKVITSKADFTEEVDKTEELSGLKHSGKKISVPGSLTFAGEVYKLPEISADTVALTGAKPLIESNGVTLAAEKTLGKGRVVYLNINLGYMLKGQASRENAIKFLSAVISQQKQPAITASGNLQVFSAVKKGNWVTISILAKGLNFWTLSDDYPVKGKIFIDVEKLGLPAGDYKVVSLARSREIMPQGKNWDFWGKVPWTGEILKNDGIDIFIPRNSMVNHELNSKVTLPYAVKFILPRWPLYNRGRSYEYELIAIAPIYETSVLDSSGKEKDKK
ncbi:MAG: DUF7408 domain-containing protein [Planctomycetota bacterium]|jgi:hypothetical protein